MQRFPFYRVKFLSTREPDQEKLYIQDYFQGKRLQVEFGFTPSPEKTHVFLCGNPAMVGAPKRIEPLGKSPIRNHRESLRSFVPLDLLPMNSRSMETFISKTTGDEKLSWEQAVLNGIQPGVEPVVVTHLRLLDLPMWI